MTNATNTRGPRSRGTRPAILARRLTVMLSATALVASVTAALAAVAGAEASAAPAPAAAGVAAPTAAAGGPTSVGRLTPRGCTGSPGAVSCDLYAKPGTIQVAGLNLPIWGFAADATTAATAPGPLLVITQGDTVTVTLHNGLTSNVSLALPGQASVDNGGTGDDLTGASPGATATYKFTASRPGTFVYEAGHTKNGARQVAMGLAGALVVIPSAGGTSDGNPSGYPDTAYDDDAPLVLSEIDPALNNSPDPLTYDLRHYRPAYRLINGQAFPQTNAIATDQGHRVLLRYVNVGQQTHAMSILGGSQTEVAQDGHPMKYSTTVTAESVDPGTTLDTLLTMPGTNGTQADAKTATKVAVYEANGALDNNAQVAGVVDGQPAQVAFGGMLTFLDTQAPVDISTDNVGPTAKSVAVSPSPSDALSDVTVTATISDAATGASPIAAAEYVIDDDNPSGSVAPGAGTAMNVADTTAVTTTATATIPASVLADANFSAGKHIVYVRGEDAHLNWGVVGSVVLNVPKTGPATTNGTATPPLTNGSSAIDISATGDDSTAGGTITAAEYFLDTAPAPAAFGSGTTMTVNRPATVVSVDANYTGAAALPEGVHHFWVHVKDDLGLWGPLLDIPVLIDKTGPTTLAATTSPPATNGVVADPSNPGYVQITAEVSDPNGALGSNLVAAEAFLATAPTAASNGKGLQMRPIDGKVDSQDEHFYALVPLSQIKAYKDGKLTIYVHGKDAAGNWGDATVNPATLLIDRVAPTLTGLSASLTAAGNPGIALTSTLAEANTLSNAEYWTSATDPGVGKATAATLSVAAGAVTVNASFPATAVTTTYHVRVRDTAGNWSAAVVGTVSPFRSNLEAATGWNVTKGSATISTAAAQPNPDENPSAHGLQTTVALANNARTAFLTNNTPVKNTAYHARFQFQAPTLSSGTNTGNWVTVFDTRTADGANNGTEVFAIQYQGSGATAKIRAVVGGTAGIAKTVGTANHTIQVDWANGSAAKLAFSVDGTVQYTVTPPGGSTATIEAAQLGISNTSVATSNSVGPVGNAWFDTFLSVGS